MASVLFIIRVPYEESSKSLQTERGNERTVKATEDNSTSKSTDDQNVGGDKFKNESEADTSGGTYELDEITHDFENLTGDLDLAKVYDFPSSSTVGNRYFGIRLIRYQVVSRPVVSLQSKVSSL